MIPDSMWEALEFTSWYTNKFWVAFPIHWDTTRKRFISLVNKKRFVPWAIISAYSSVICTLSILVLIYEKTVPKDANLERLVIRLLFAVVGVITQGGMLLLLHANEISYALNILKLYSNNSKASGKLITKNYINISLINLN